jgi:hypothetical protein
VTSDSAPANYPVPPQTVEAMRAFVAAVPRARPLLDEHLSDNFGELLPHVLMADLRRFFVTAVETGDQDTLERFIAALEVLEASDDPDVRNVAEVSFMEDLVMGADARDAAAIAAMRPLMGPATAHDLALMESYTRGNQPRT